MKEENWKNQYNDFIGGLVNLSVTAIVLFFTSTQAAKAIYFNKIFHSLFLGLGTLSLLILFIIGVVAFVDEKANPLFNKVKSNILRAILMIAISFFLLMPTFYTLFLADLLKIQ
ncbi:hypothetical protein ACL9Z5_000833 [Acinetobacter calcoaceticus]